MSRPILPYSIVLVTVTGILALFALFALEAYPLPYGDATHFIPPVLNLLRGKQLTNILWPLLRQNLGEDGSAIFTGHGFLYQLYLGVVGTPYLPHLYFAHAASAAAVLIGSLLLFRSLLRRFISTIRIRDAVLASAALLGLSTHLVGFGRPDIFAEMWIVLAGIACFTFTPGVLRIALPLLIGLATASSVTVPCFALPLLGMLLAARYPTKRAILELVYFIVVPIFVVGVLVFLLYPYRLEDWTDGLLFHATEALRQLWTIRNKWFDLTGIRYYWILNPSQTFYGVALFLAVQMAASLFFRAKSAIAAPLLFWTCYSLLLAAIVFLTILRPVCVYRFLPFTPFMYTALLLPALQARSWKSIDFLFNFGVILMTSVGFLRFTALYPTFIIHGQSYDEARAAYQSLSPQLGKKIAVTGSLWVLGEDISRFRRAELTKDDSLIGVNRPSAVLIQQQYAARLAPPQLSDWREIYSSFSDYQPKFFGLPLGTAAPGYQFAAYLPRRGAQ